MLYTDTATIQILACNAVLYSVLDLAALCVIKAVESTYQISCYSSDPLERNSGEVIVHLGVIAVQRYVDRVDSLAGVKIVSPGNISLLFLLGKLAVFNIYVYHKYSPLFFIMLYCVYYNITICGVCQGLCR